MGKNILEQFEQAIEKAKEELSRASYLEECGANKGLRKMNANKAEWLSCLIYLAERCLSEDNNGQMKETVTINESCKECLVGEELKKLVEAKDAIIDKLKVDNDLLTSQNKTLSTRIAGIKADLEKYLVELIERAFVDLLTMCKEVAFEVDDFNEDINMAVELDDIVSAVYAVNEKYFQN